MDFIAKIKALLAAQRGTVKVGQVLVSILGVLVIGGAGIGIFSLYEAKYGPDAVVSAEVNAETVDTQQEIIVQENTQETQISENIEETEVVTELSTETEAVSETELVTETETETEIESEVEKILVKMTGSSIERDLKIKIQDGNGKIVKGVEFCIVVTPDKENAVGSAFRDRDKDGIIYIVDYDGGDYTITLREIEGYYTEEESIKVTVKEQIAYEEVEVKDEIKSEAEVSPEEDAEVNDGIAVEAEIKDTVAWLESKVLSTNVDISAIDKDTYLEVASSAETYDPTIALEDKEGDILYTDSNCTSIATVEDLVEKNVTAFYKNPKYQGWQAIDGKLCYFDEEGQAVTGEQIINGIMYSFDTEGEISQSANSTGIDVSKWQGTVDWNAVKAAGIEFAIIRVGYRGSATGVLVEDPTFKQNIKGATAAGLKVGVYFFTQAITKAEAIEEASMALSLTAGYDLAFPIFIDTEIGSGNARANGLDKTTRTEIVEAFCKTIQNGGQKAGIYASRNWYNDKLDTGKLNNYFIWVAQYNTECTYTGHYDMWQYTESGKIPGVEKEVDLNIHYKT